jgi:FkbM family methyltransferase
VSALARLRAARRRHLRHSFVKSAQREVRVLGVEHAAGVFIVPSKDKTIFPKILVGEGRSDLVVLDRAVGTLRTLGSRCGGTFVDVGANLGTTTMAACRLHGFSSAVSCEADPENARFLRATVIINGLESVVTVVEAAIADTAGELRFAPGGESKSGAGRLAAGGSILVRATTLDALAEAGVFAPGGVGLAWMDVQGAEGLVLRGAGALSTAGVPFVAALRPARVAALDDVDAFAALLEERFSSFVDLRFPTLKGDWTPYFRPVSEIRNLIRGRRSTDVLLLP